jgi:hypothetical protein
MIQLVIKNDTRGQNLPLTCQFTAHRSGQNYLHNKMILLVIKKYYERRPNNPLIITLKFTAHK